MRETKNIEFKEKVTSTFLKTVSAYANYGTGKIYFGISDDGTAIGIDDINKTCLSIENKINDSLDPVPNYSFEINNKKKIIILTVEEGMNKPYLYNSKAYRRNDTATVQVDRLDLTRLILEGGNMDYEQLPAKTKGLTFKILSKSLKEALNISNFSEDTLKTLELFSPEGKANIAAELLADKNSFSGIDIVKFGKSINFIHDRETYEHVSVIKQYEKAVEIFRKYYAYEEIKGVKRVTTYKIPEEAFRESIANALVHRTWDIHSNINVAMRQEGITITSIGGLPKGMSEKMFYKGGVSLLRNRILGNVFYRLSLIEKFGTGIERIMESYKDCVVKPSFDISESSVRVYLPVISGLKELTTDENEVYECVKGKKVPSSVVAKETGFGKSKTVGLLKDLTKRGYITSSGNGRGIKYSA